MPRKPNYRFERAERDRVKAQKKEERLKAKAERQGQAADAAAHSPDPSAADPFGGDGRVDTLHVTVEDDPTK